jgi:predicted MPP superfamily phosphohydrolase
VPAISRRTVLKGLAAIAAGTGAGFAIHGYAVERHQLGVVRCDLPMRGLGAAFDGLRIGYLSDLHHSEFVGIEDIQRAVALVAAERPDLVILGGDYVSYGDVQYADPCAQVLATLTAPLGVYAVLGNHDDERSVPDALRRRGIPVLRDAYTAVTKNGDAITLAGIRFWTREPADVARAIGSAPGPVLLAAHDPRRIFEAAWLNVAGVLSGHTHGGQLVLPGLGAIAARKFPVAAGRMTRGPSEMFVSRGVGTVILPVRINCPPEVNIITLRRHESAS